MKKKKKNQSINPIFSAVCRYSSTHWVQKQEPMFTKSKSNTHSVDEEILRLQISMKNISAVTESKAFQQLVHEGLQRKPKEDEIRFKAFKNTIHWQSEY